MTLNELIKSMQEEAKKYGEYEIDVVLVHGTQEELIIKKDDDKKEITIF